MRRLVCVCVKLCELSMLWCLIGTGFSLLVFVQKQLYRVVLRAFCERASSSHATWCRWAVHYRSLIHAGDYECASLELVQRSKQRTMRATHLRRGVPTSDACGRTEDVCETLNRTTRTTAGPTEAGTATRAGRPTHF